MPNYVAELYDKDNDTYKIIAISSDEQELRKRCRIVEVLIHQDMVINYIPNGDDELIKEPFDVLHIRPVKAGEQINTYNLFMC